MHCVGKVQRFEVLYYVKLKQSLYRPGGALIVLGS